MRYDAPPDVRHPRFIPHTSYLIPENWGRRRDLHSRGAIARRFTKPLLSLLSHVGWENCRLPMANLQLIGGRSRSQSAIANRQSAMKLVGRHGAAPCSAV